MCEREIDRDRDREKQTDRQRCNDRDRQRHACLYADEFIWFKFCKNIIQVVFLFLTAGPTEAPYIVAAAGFADAMHHVSQRKEINHLYYVY